MSKFNSFTDAELWRRMQERDDDAYAFIYERHVDAMYNYALKLNFHSTDIEDAIHDLFVKLYMHRGRIHAIRNIKVYLFIALKNMLLNKIGTRKFIPFSADMIHATDHSIEDTIIERELESKNKKLLRQVFQLLTKRQRQVIFYRYYKKLSYKEIADILDINEQSAKNLAQTAIKRLRIGFAQLIALIFIVFLLL